MATFNRRFPALADQTILLAIATGSGVLASSATDAIAGSNAALPFDILASLAVLAYALALGAPIGRVLARTAVQTVVRAVAACVGPELAGRTVHAAR